MSASTLTPSGHVAARAGRKHPSHRLVVPLGRYRQADGLAREVVLLPGAGETQLLVDRLAGGLGDRRLVAHLPADEPASNAQLICRSYLADWRRGCRRLTAADITAPAIEQPRLTDQPCEIQLSGRDGRRYRLQAIDAGRLKLSWTRLADDGAWLPLTLKDLIGAIEHYDPALEITRGALSRASPGIAKGPLAGQLTCVERMSVVLNRGLREAVLHATADTDLSVSEIAIRCGRVKRNSDGKVSGETSWLTRRIGLAPDGSTGKPTPWIRHELLALIARKGLSLAPGEVEIGSALCRSWSARG